MTARHLRTLRGAAAAWVATVVAATSHTLAGGGAPAPALVGVIGILAWPVGIALVGRRLSPWRVGSAVVAAQLVFHTAFAATAGGAPQAGSTVVAGHAHHTAGFATGTGAAVFAVDAPMAIGHLLAAAVTVAGLYCGERMLRALGRGIRSLFTRSVVRVHPSIPAVPALEPVLPSDAPLGRRPCRISHAGVLRHSSTRSSDRRSSGTRNPAPADVLRTPSGAPMTKENPCLIPASPRACGAPR